MNSQSGTSLGGFYISNTTAMELAQHLIARLQPRQQTALFFANTNFIVQCRDLHARMTEDNIIIVNDGIGMKVAARLVRGKRFKENLNGTDFMPFLLKQSPQPLRLFMLGGKPEVLQKAAQYARQQLDQDVVGTCDGYADLCANKHLIDTINQAQADIVLVALGNPIQEKWILDHRQDLHAGIVTGVGALFDFWAGDKPRAPRFIQKIRMEWFYRLCLEPKRLARRYTIDIVHFLLNCFRYR